MVCLAAGSDIRSPQTIRQDLLFHTVKSMPCHADPLLHMMEQATCNCCPLALVMLLTLLHIRVSVLIKSQVDNQAQAKHYPASRAISQQAWCLTYSKGQYMHG